MNTNFADVLNFTDEELDELFTIAPEDRLSELSIANAVEMMAGEIIQDSTINCVNCDGCGAVLTYTGDRAWVVAVNWVGDGDMSLPVAPVEDTLKAYPICEQCRDHRVAGSDYRMIYETGFACESIADRIRDRLHGIFMAAVTQSLNCDGCGADLTYTGDRAWAVAVNWVGDSDTTSLFAPVANTFSVYAICEQCRDHRVKGADYRIIYESAYTLI